MNGRILTQDKAILSIGSYLLNVSYISSLGTYYFIPFSGEAFLRSGSFPEQKSDFNYIIQLEGSFSEPAEKPAAGFDRGPYHYRVYQEEAGEYLWTVKNRLGENQLVYRISEDWSSWTLVYDSTGSLGLDAFSNLSAIFGYSVLDKGGIMFHGTVMEWKGKGILVCAHSGVGKTTHSRMWRDYENALILNGDRVLCRMEEDGWYAYGSPWSGSSGEYINRKVPVTAFVLLEQAPENEVVGLTGYQGALGLISLAFAPSWNEKLMNCALDAIDSIARGIPILKLRCRPDRDAVETLKKVIEEI